MGKGNKFRNRSDGPISKSNNVPIGASLVDAHSSLQFVDNDSALLPSDCPVHGGFLTLSNCDVLEFDSSLISDTY